jgi:O-antigen/teichoic acid export membrane protein
MQNRALTNSSFRGGKKQLALNILANIISYGIGIAISFILTPILINKLGRDAYSFYPLSTTITNTMTIVTTSLNSMASRFIAISLHKNDEKNANSYFASTLFTDFILSIILLAIMSVFIICITYILNIPINLVASVRVLFIFTFSSMLVNVMSTVFGVATFARNRIDLRSYREIAASLIRLGLFIIFFLVLPPSLVYIGIITLVVAAFNLIIQLFFTRKLLPEIKLSRKNISKQHIKNLFSSSVWVMLNSLGNTLLVSSTLFLLNRLYGTTESSVVSISLTIPSFMGGIISMLVGVYFPLITKKIADNDIEGLKKETETVQLVVGSVGCAIIAVFTWLSSVFFALWVPSENSSLLSLLSIINLVPYLSTACFWVCTSVNTAMNKVKIPAIATVSFGLLNILIQLIFGLLKINYISLPIICSTVQFLWTGIFMPVYLSKTLKTKWYYFFPPFLKLLGITVFVYGLIFALSEFIFINSWFKFILFGGTFGLMTLIIFFVALQPNLVVKLYRKVLKK